MKKPNLRVVKDGEKRMNFKDQFMAFLKSNPEYVHRINAFRVARFGAEFYPKDITLVFKTTFDPYKGAVWYYWEVISNKHGLTSQTGCPGEWWI